jgi:hypothetical protein
MGGGLCDCDVGVGVELVCVEQSAMLDRIWERAQKVAWASRECLR